MKHPLPWSVPGWPLNVYDAAGKFVCEARDENAAREIVAVSELAHAAMREGQRPEPTGDMNIPKR
jgi:hypothetical protein